MDTTQLSKDLNGWISQQTLPLAVRSADVSTYEDILGEEGLDVVLRLASPDGDTWDTGTLYETRRLVHDKVNDLAQATGMSLDATTIIRATIDTPSSDEVAEDDPGTDPTDDDQAPELTTER